MRFSRLFLSLSCMSANLMATSITINGAHVVNGTAAVFAPSYDSVSFQNGTVDNYGLFAESANNITLSGGVFTNNLGAELGRTLTGSITVSSQATLINSGNVAESSAFYMTGGTLTNSGEIGLNGNVYITGGNISFSAGSKIGQSSGAVEISNVTFANSAGAEIASSATLLTISNATVTNNGSIAYGATNLDLTSGSITNSGSLAENLVGTLNVTNQSIINSGLIGSVTAASFNSGLLINTGTFQAIDLQLVNSTITNNSYLSLNSGNLTSHEINGTGVLYISNSNVNSSVPITQGTVIVGTASQPSFLITDQNIIANVEIVDPASELQTNANVTVTNLNAAGKVNPGIAQYNTLTLSGAGTLTNTSTYLVDISSYNGPADKILANGNFSIEPGATLVLNFPDNVFPNKALYTILQSQTGSITGTFSNIVIPPLSGTIQVIYNTNSIQLSTDLDGPGVSQWTSAVGDTLWLNPGNWYDGGVPFSSDTAIFNPSFNAVGNVSLSNASIAGSPTAAALSFTPNSGEYGTYTFIGGELYLNGNGNGTDIISGGGTQDLSSITIHLMNALSYNINTGGNYSFGNIQSDYAGGSHPSLIFTGTSSYALTGNIGQSFASLAFNNMTVSATNAVIGEGAGSIDLTGANLSLVNTNLGENLGGYSVSSSGNLILNGGALTVVGSSEIGTGALGTVSVDNLTFSLPAGAKLGDNSNKLIITDATISNSGQIGNFASTVIFASGSIVNLGDLGTDASSVTLSGAFYNSTGANAGNGAETLIITQNLSNDGSFGVAAGTVSAQNVINAGVFGGNGSNISTLNVQNIGPYANFGESSATITVSGSVYNEKVFGSNASYIHTDSDVVLTAAATFGSQTNAASTAVVDVDGNVVVNTDAFFGHQANVINVGGSVYNTGNFGSLNPSGSITVSGALNNTNVFGQGVNYINIGSDVINSHYLGYNDVLNPSSILIVAGNVQNSGVLAPRMGTVSVSGNLTNTNSFANFAKNISIGGFVVNEASSQIGYNDIASDTTINITGYVINNPNSSIGYSAGTITVGGSLTNTGIFGRNNTDQVVSVSGTVFNYGEFANEAKSITTGDVVNTANFGSNNTNAVVSAVNVVNNTGNFANTAGTITISGSVYNTGIFGNEFKTITIASDVVNTNQLGLQVANIGTGNISFGGSVYNLGTMAFKVGTITVSGSVNNLSDFGRNALSIDVGSDVTNSLYFGYQESASEASIVIDGNVLNNVINDSWLGYRASNIQVGGYVDNAWVFGAGNTNQTINITGSVTNNYIVGEQAKSIYVGNDVVNNVAFGQFAGTISVGGSVFNAVTFGSDNLEQIITVAGSVTNNGNFGIQAKSVTTGDVINQGQFVTTNSLASVSVGNAQNILNSSHFAVNIGTFTASGSAYNEGFMGHNASYINIASDVSNISLDPSAPSYFGYQDVVGNSVIYIGGNVKNLGAGSNFGNQVGNITVVGTIYNEGTFGCNNPAQVLNLQGDINNISNFANVVHSAVVSNASISNTNQALNNASSNISFTNVSVSNEATGVMLVNTPVLNITGSVNNSGGFGDGALNITFGGTFVNQSSASAFNTMGAQIALNTATVTNSSGANFGNNASTITIVGGSIVNSGAFGDNASLVLSGNAYFENTSTVGNTQKLSVSKTFKSLPKNETNLQKTSLNVSDEEDVLLNQPAVNTSSNGLEISSEQVIILNGQAFETSYYLESLISGDNAGQLTTQEYNLAITLPQNQQEAAFFEMSPQFKVVQFAQEKLDLLLHKELQSELYQKSDKNRLFVLGGYDNFNQHKQSGYAGYNVDNFYQLLGVVAHSGSMKWLTCLGASESYMDLSPTKSTASYPAVWGSLGVSSQHKNWIYGIDGLFGYSFIHTKRKVNFLDEQATSNHGLWSVSFDAKFGYRFSLKTKKTKEIESGFIFKTKKQTVEEKEYMAITPYDIFGYLYGQENQYSEKGTLGNNYHVKNEDISVIRNQLGLKFDCFINKHHTFFADGAWVYDYYTNDNTYQAAIVGTNVYGNFTQALPTKNYGRIQAGFMGDYKNFDWRLSYTGLYGKYLQDSSVSLRLGFKL